MSKEEIEELQDNILEAQKEIAEHESAALLALQHRPVHFALKLAARYFSKPTEKQPTYDEWDKPPEERHDLQPNGAA